MGGSSGRSRRRKLTNAFENTPDREGVRIGTSDIHSQRENTPASLVPAMHISSQPCRVPAHSAQLIEGSWISHSRLRRQLLGSMVAYSNSPWRLTQRENIDFLIGRSSAKRWVGKPKVGNRKAESETGKPISHSRSVNRTNISQPLPSS